MLKSDRNALRGSFGFYRAFWTTAAQNTQRMTQKLSLPVLALGGAESGMDNAGRAMGQVADNVQTVVVSGGHWVAEQAPDEIMAALTTFLAPYRDGQ
jgi:pimeloyl-ACP methyl ester carboxylesterase